MKNSPMVLAIVLSLVPTCVCQAKSLPAPPDATDPGEVGIPSDIVSRCKRAPTSSSDFKVVQASMVMRKADKYAGVVYLCVTAPIEKRENVRVGFTLAIGASPVGFYGDTSVNCPPKSNSPNEPYTKPAPAMCSAGRFLMTARSLRTCSKDFPPTADVNLPFGCAFDPKPTDAANSTLTYSATWKGASPRRGTVNIAEVRYID